MMLAETGNGFLREIFIAPVIGANRARQASVLLGSAIVLLIAWACSRRLRADTTRSQLLVGGLWVFLTVVFELSLASAAGRSWPDALSDYNPAQGGLMLLGLAVMFIAPLLTARKTG